MYIGIFLKSLTLRQQDEKTIFNTKVKTKLSGLIPLNLQNSQR